MPLKDWVKKCAVSGKLERVRRVALIYLASVKKSQLVVLFDSISICPHEKLHMVGEEMTRECQVSKKLVDRAWSKNVPVVYNMLKSFNVDTAHKISLEVCPISGTEIRALADN